MATEAYIPKPALEVEYYVVNDLMTDAEFDNVESKKFIITEDMIQELLEDHIVLNRATGETIDQFYIKLL